MEYDFQSRIFSIFQYILSSGSMSLQLKFYKICIHYQLSINALSSTDVKSFDVIPPEGSKCWIAIAPSGCSYSEVGFLCSFLLFQSLYSFKELQLAPARFFGNNFGILPVNTSWAERCMFGQTTIPFIHTFLGFLIVSIVQVLQGKPYLVSVFFLPGLPLTVCFACVGMFFTLAGDPVDNVFFQLEGFLHCWIVL